MPIRLRERVKLITALIVPELPHSLILGRDFWYIMEIVPDLRQNEWHFTEDPEELMETQDQPQTVLTPEETRLLQDVVNRHQELMGNALGCASVTEHVIKTLAEPIRQRYYRVSPIMQKYIDEEL